jgi:hypothetical protein
VEGGLNRKIYAGKPQTFILLVFADFIGLTKLRIFIQKL